jgi:hypothetical protein
MGGYGALAHDNANTANLLAGCYAEGGTHSSFGQQVGAGTFGGRMPVDGGSANFDLPKFKKSFGTHAETGHCVDRRTRSRIVVLAAHESSF